jgi:predicted GNAT family acetyltransferase
MKSAASMMFLPGPLLTCIRGNLSTDGSFGVELDPLESAMPELTDLVDNTEKSRFELGVGGETVFANYRRSEGVITVMWVEAPPALRGTGAAGRLMTLVAEQARREGAKIVPVCGYAAAWLRASKTSRDLVL